jgi:hypothetical protein
MAKKFSMSDWYRTHGHSGKTTVNLDGYKVRLDGEPTVYTKAALAALAKGQDAEELRVTPPRGKTAEGIGYGGSKLFAPEEVAQAIRHYSADPADAPAPAPSPNGRGVTVPS